MKNKLIEVALPLDAINKAAAREKSIRRGHLSTLYPSGTLRPLAEGQTAVSAQPETRTTVGLPVDTVEPPS